MKAKHLLAIVPMILVLTSCAETKPIDMHEKLYGTARPPELTTRQNNEVINAFEDLDEFLTQIQGMTFSDFKVTELIDNRTFEDVRQAEDVVDLEGNPWIQLHYGSQKQVVSVEEWKLLDEYRPGQVGVASILYDMESDYFGKTAAFDSVLYELRYKPTPEHTGFDMFWWYETLHTLFENHMNMYPKFNDTNAVLAFYEQTHGTSLLRDLLIISREYDGPIITGLNVDTDGEDIIATLRHDYITYLLEENEKNESQEFKIGE